MKPISAILWIGIPVALGRILHLMKIESGVTFMMTLPHCHLLTHQILKCN